MNPDGTPVLDHAKKMMVYAEQLPRNQLPNVTKIFSLHPYSAGVLFAGISGIGNLSVRRLVEIFLDSTPYDHEYKLSEVAQSFADFLDARFEDAHQETPKELRPGMEILLSGFSGDHDLRDPEIYRILCGNESSVTNELADRFDIVYGGQHDVIQRVVQGIDVSSFYSLNQSSREVVQNYHDDIVALLRSQGFEGDVPDPDFENPRYRLFAKNFGGVTGIFSDIAGLSEQAAINFVEFLINTMIHAQEFSDRIPTVGGEVHLGLITKTNGFKWISKEEYKFKNHSVPIHE